MLSLVLLLVYASLQVGDVITTYMALSRPGLREGNPVTAYAIRLLGTSGGIAMTKGIALAMGVVILMLTKESTGGTWVLGLLDTAYAAVVGWNVWQLLKG